MSGGLVSSAATMLDKLVGSGDMLYVEYNDGTSEVLYSSNSREVNITMTVLVNEGTAGAGEFFAAGLRDFGEAKIVGSQTAGVGSLQKIFKLDDGSAIQLTIGKYYLSNSQSAWEQTGVTPDHAVSLDYALDLTDISLLDTNLDTQLAKAIEVTSSSILPTDSEDSAEGTSDEG